jgi:hypothetical protein
LLKLLNNEAIENPQFRTTPLAFGDNVLERLGFDGEVSWTRELNTVMHCRQFNEMIDTWMHKNRIYRSLLYSGTV